MPSKFLDAVKSIFNPEEYYGDDFFINKILTEYKSKKHNYEEFRQAAHNTLNSLLKESNLKYQLTSRTKSFERLKEKLIRKKREDVQYRILDDIEDLVGLRVIFYTEKDKDRFVKIMTKEIDGSLKIEEREKDGGYTATHIIMSFGPKRLQLSEYKRFKGLKSEIQVTSLLHHTWAEIEHDLIYKDLIGLKDKDPKKFETMKERMKEILEKYIKKASAELEDLIQNYTK